MSHHKKTNHKKSSLSSSSSSSSSSSCSSENNHWQNIEQSTFGSAIKRPIYPNVPKRSQRSSFNHNHEIIQTESRIDIIPSEKYSQNSNEYLSMPSSSNQDAYTRHTLGLITKYTSPQKKSENSLSVIHSISNSTQSINESKYKRTLSPLDEINHESKRTKSSDDDEDDEELSQFLDHRLIKQSLSQNSNTTISFQSQTDIEQNKSTGRKPTFRKLSTSQQKPILSQPKPIETLPIELDIEMEEDNLISQTETRWSSTRSQLPNIHHNVNKEFEDTNQSILTSIIPSPIKFAIENYVGSLHSTPTKLPIGNGTDSLHSTPTRSSKKIREHLINNLSPCLNNETGVGERRFSMSSSLSSLLFDTPNTSFSHTTIDNTTSTPRNSIKNDCETQITSPSNLDMINQLILQMNINLNDNENKIDYDPIEISKKCFHQCISLTKNTYLTMDLLIKKQFLHFGRYEIEISFPINHDKNSTIYACDVCLKHFHGSSIAFQRHTAKCLYTQPPGKLVFNKDDLAIFEIGQTSINMEQRIYIKSLCRIVRLFIDPNKNIDDTKIDKFTYYILCRKDPTLSQFQSSIYHFIGYFSKEHNQQIQQQSINNLSCLFILPPFVQHQQYNQCLIAFSYSLIRSNDSANLMYSSPARPLDNLTLFAFRNYWRDILFAYIINHNYSSIKSLALDIFARQTSIHPRDILSSLYSNGSIVPHPTDKSSVYLLNKAYHSMTSLNLHTRTKFLFMDMDLINNNEKKKTTHDNLNTDKSLDSGIEEIVLD